MDDNQAFALNPEDEIQKSFISDLSNKVLLASR